MPTRTDGRALDALRPLKIQVGLRRRVGVDHARQDGGALRGQRRRPAAAFLRGTTQGWVTAEYAMLPRSTLTRSQRESVAGRIGGRTHEIQRLIGRSLRAVVDLHALGERTFAVDCDVLQADGGTRTASITGAYVALAQAMGKLVADGVYPKLPISTAVAATSVGIVDGAAMLDLKYDEDVRAEVDFNVVMTGESRYVEVQGTAEHGTFPREAMDSLLSLAEKGIRDSMQVQRDVLSEAGLPVL